MKAVLLAVLALWIAAGVGRLLVGRMRVLADWPLERAVYAAALGLGIAAYGVLALGLCGLLSFWPITFWWLFLAALGVVGMRANTQDLVNAIKGVGEAVRAWKTAGGLNRFVCVLGLSSCLLFGAFAVIACFQPPGGREWDVIAYHLADPKVFLAQHRVFSMPTEHHSNFPLTMEMLYTVGLLYAGYPLADLFHFLTAALTAAAIFAFCRRMLSSSVGWIAVTLFVTTPAVLWEASVAYIDLGVGLFVALSAFAALSAIDAEEDRAREWVLLSGATMGFALGLKYLALIPFALIGLLLLLRRMSLKRVGAYAAVALVIASPWYVKNIVLTHNPVYPFFYKAFPQSRYWSYDRAAAYQSEQDSFGFPHSLRQPSELLQNLILTPFRLVTDADKYANTGDFTFSVLMGGLYAGLCFALAFVRRVPRVVRDLLLLGLAQLIAWFFLTQIGRYLVSLLPLFSVVAGYAAWRLLMPAEAGKEESVLEGRSQSSSALSADFLLIRGVVIAALCGQVLLVLWASFALPTSARDAMESGLMPTAFSVPEDVSLLAQPDRRDDLLSRRLDIYDAISWINAHAPQDAGVILYEETRGFYLDRPYLWGNAQHSTYIPYASMRRGADLTAWLRQHGIRYALFNLNLIWPKFQQGSRYKDNPDWARGPAGHEAEALQQWYEEAPANGEHWRAILGDAMKNNGWTLQYPQSDNPPHGVAVMEIGGSTASASAHPPKRKRG